MKQPTPPGLLSVQDLITRHADDRAAILSHEIHHREQERVLYEGVSSAFRTHPWGVTKRVLAAGLSVFFFAITIGELSHLAQSFQAMRKAIGNSIGPAANLLHINLDALMPPADILRYASQFPAWDWKDSLTIALAGMVLVLAEQLVVAVFTWKKTQALKAADTELEQEIEALKEWQK